MIQEITQLFERDIHKMIFEIEEYPDESLLCELAGNILNRPGNLAIHIDGNLQHFIGAVLGGSNYVRNRFNEFNARELTRDQILGELKVGLQIVQTVLPKLDPIILTENYPIEVFGKPMNTCYFLIHLHGHLNYHLGQINYHRRIVSV